MIFPVRWLNNACSFVLVFAVLGLASAAEAQNNRVPLVNQPLVPDSAAPGGAGFTLTVNGTGFASGASVLWNGSPRTNTFVSASQLTAAISAADIAAPGTVSVTVVNPAPGGGSSNTVFFTIRNPSSVAVFASAPGSPMSLGMYGYPSSVAVGDFNGDGKLDLAVPSVGYNQVAILLGNGDGTFTVAPSSPASGDFPLAIAAGDFNGDGKLDLAVASSNNVTILLGNGDGTFTPSPQSPPSIYGPTSVAVGDFNGDGKVDLAVLSSHDSVTILLGNGDGTFSSAAQQPTTGGFPNAIVTGDFNGDGKLDLAVANTLSKSLTILLGNGDGTFTAAPSPATGWIPFSLVAGDFNGDGILDLAVANSNSNNVTILLGNGDGTFTSAASPPSTGSYPYRIASGDFNGDGKLDLAVANLAPYNITILLGNGDGSFAPASTPATGNSPYGLATGDFNGDGGLDIVAANWYDGTVSVLLNSFSPIPIATVSSAGLGFPPQNVGTTSQPLSVTFSNTGNATLTISGIVALGPFAQTSNCGNSLSAGSVCTINVTFTPKSVGDSYGWLTITDNSADGGTQTLFLEGTTPGVPSASFSPGYLVFGAQKVGTTSSPAYVNLTSSGAKPLVITSITVSGDFSQSNNCPGSLAPGAACTITVWFTPTQIALRTGAITVSDNAADSPQGVPLSGIGGYPIASLSTPSLIFANQDVGTTSPPTDVSLSNPGTEPLTVSSIVISGDFAQTNNCGSSVAAGASCNISVTFSPATTGVRYGTLTVTDNNNGVNGSTQTVSLTGIAINPKASVSRTSLPLGNQAIATTSAPRTVTLISTGTTTLLMSNFTFTGANAGDFSQSNNCPLGLAPGAKCTISVTFTPSTLGAESATLNVNDNAANSPQTVVLSGTGVAQATVRPASITFAPRTVGTTSLLQGVMLKNNLLAALAIGDIKITGADASDFAVVSNGCGASLAAKSRCAIIVRFTPTAIGPRAATLNVNDSANHSPQTVALNGTGK